MSYTYWHANEPDGRQLTTANYLGQRWVDILKIPIKHSSSRRHFVRKWRPNYEKLSCASSVSLIRNRMVTYQPDS